MVATDPGRIAGVVLCVLALSATPASPQGCDGELGAARSYVVGDAPSGIAPGDFDSDGIPDLAVANNGAASSDPGISVLLGNGDGSLRAGTAIAGLANPSFVVTSDLDRDGALDLAVVSSASQETFIFLGDGRGAFTLAGSFGTGHTSNWIASGDVNGDGDTDLVNLDWAAGTLTLLMGTGGGAFAVAGSLTTGGFYSVGVAVVDFDSDTKLDLLTGNWDSVSFLKGDGAGGFQAPVVFPSPRRATGMAVGRLDADPYVDVVMTSGGGIYPTGVWVLLGNGSGGFRQGQGFGAGDNPVGVTIADVDADGRSDVLVTNWGSGELDILLGDGAGNLSSPTALVTGEDPVLPIPVDLDRDGVSDVAVTCRGSNTVSTLRGRAGALPPGAVAYDTWNKPTRVVALDADGDWDRDLVAVGMYGLAVMTNDGSGAFQVGFSGTSTSGVTDMIAGDWNGDGTVDLAMARGIADWVAIYLGVAGGGFLGPATFPTDTGPRALAAADFDGDGTTDLVSVNDGDTASILLGSGTGSFSAPVNVFVGGSPVDVVATDLDGDGADDLAVCRQGGDDVSILLGSGDGTFQPAMLVGLGSSSAPLAIAGGLFDAGGVPDLAVGGGASGAPSAWVLIGNGDGTFQAPVAYGTDARPSAIETVDLDGNGTLDLALALRDTFEVTLMSGAGNGTFSTMASYDVGYPEGVAVADLNSDGAPDLVGANDTATYPTSVSVALTTGPQILPGSLPSGFVGAPYTQTLSLSGGAPPVTFTLLGGTLPLGVALSSAGVLSGTPTAGGAYFFTVMATDGSGCPASRTYRFTIDPKVVYLAGQGLGTPNPNRVRLLGKSGGLAIDFLAYAGRWGVNVTSGNVDGGAYDEILTGPGPGAANGPQVRAFTNAGAAIAKVNFYAYGTLRYGVNVGSGRIDGDGYGEILSGAGPGAVFGPHVRGFDFDAASITPIAKVSYFAYSTLTYGVHVTAGDLDADGYGEIATGAGPGSVFGSHVRGFNVDGTSVTSMGKVSFFAFSHSEYGVNVALGDVEADGYHEIAASPGPGFWEPCRFLGFDYDAASVSALPGFDVTRSDSDYGGRVAVGDVTGDGNADLVTGLGRDPSAAAMLLSYTYDGSALAATGAAFAAFPGTYGVNVSWGTFD